MSNTTSQLSVRLSLQGAEQVRAGLRQVEGSVGSFASAAQAATAALGPMMSALTAGAAIGKLVAVQREFDVLNSSLKTAAGGSAAAAKEMEWIKQFAKETPFGLAQATQAFVKMKVLGLDPSRAALTSYGNTASAMGKDLNQMIEAVADASTGEFERLKEFGIKASKEGDKVKLTFQGVTKTIGNNAGEINAYLQSIGDNQFAGAMADRAIASFSDTWDELFRTISAQNAGSLMHDSVRMAEGAVTDLTTIIQALNGATSENAQQTGALATIQEGLATAFETVAVLGVNVKYTLVQIGKELGGLAAQAVSVATGQFAQAAEIGRLMRSDAAAARAEVDATSARILNARKVAALGLPNNYDEPAVIRARASAAAAEAKAKKDAAAAAAKQASAEAAAAAAAKKSASDAKKELAQFASALETVREKSSGLNANYTETLSTLYKGYQKGRIGADDYRTAVESLIQQQPFFVAGEKAKAEAEKELAAARAGSLKISEAAEAAQAATADQLAERLATMRDEIATIGLTTEQVAALTAQKEQQIIADKEIELIMLRNADASAAQISALEREINLRRQLAGAIRENSVKETAAESADAAQKEWKKTADQIEQSLTDALMRGFESGKGFAETLRDTVVNMFKTMVLRPVVQAIVSPVAGAITGSLGLAGAANASTGASALGMASNASSLYSLGSNLTGMGGIASSAGILSGSTYGTAALSQQSIMLAAQEAGIAASASTAGAMSSFASVALPAAAAVAALAAVGAFRSTKTVGGGLTGTLGSGDINSYDLNRKSGYLFGGPSYSIADKGVAEQSAALQTAFTTSRTAMAAMADTLGLGSDAVKKFTTSIGKDLIHPDTGGLGLKLDGLTPEQSAAKVQAALASASDDMASLVLGTTAYTRTGETASATLARLSTSLTAVNTQFGVMGVDLLDVSLRGADVASALIDAMGGMESASAKLGAYYNNYYTDAEKTANTTRTLTETLGKLGLALPETREGFRALVDAQDRNTESGRTAYATLMGVQDAFATLAPSAADLATQLGTVTDAIGKMFNELRGQIGSVRSAVASGRETITGGPSVRTYAQIMASINRTGTAAPSRTALSAAETTANTAARNVSTAKTGLATAQSSLTRATTAASTAQSNSTRYQTNVDTQAIDAVATYLRFGNVNQLLGVTAPANLAGLATWNDTQANMESRLAGVPIADIRAFAATLSKAPTSGLRGELGSTQTFIREIGQYLGSVSAQSAAQPGLDAQIRSTATALTAAQTAVNTANRTLSTSTTAATTANRALETAKTNYATTVTAWVNASTLSADALGKLKDETLAYYEQQKALAETMHTSATGLRTAVAAAQMQTLTSTQNLSVRLGEFAQSYSLARATTGAVKAGYADKMANALPQLSADLADTSASRVDWVVAVAKLTNQSQTIANQLDATAPATYEAESLTLLDAIDGKLKSMNTTAESLQVSITTAVNNGATRTATGLSNLIKAVHGNKSASLATFATGGVFASGIVTKPTMFDMGLMGEAGPEAIMPLSRGPGGALGVQVYGAGQSGGDTAAQRDAQRELLAEVKRLGERLDKTREELRQMRQENNIGNAKIADSTDRSARLHERWSVVGLPATEAAHA